MRGDGGNRNAENFNGAQIAWQGVPPASLQLLGELQEGEREGDSHSCGEAGPDAVSPQVTPSPWEAGVLAGPLLYGVPMLSFLKKERAAFLGLQAYCLKILLPKSPVPPTGVPIWPSQVPLCQLCHRWSLPWKSPQFRLVPRREPTAFRLCHMLLVSPTQ